MPFGLSFGTNRTRSSGTSTVNRDETNTQSGSESTNSTSTGTTTGSSTSGSQSSGTSATTQVNDQTGNTTNRTSGSTTSNSFSDALAGGVESTISALLGQFGGAAEVLGRGVEGLGNFDATSFINNTVAAAEAQQQSGLDESIGGLIDSIGGNVDSNSAAALLANRLRGDAAANVAGVRSQATGQAQEILRGNLAGQAGAMSSLNNLAPALIEAFSGSNVTGTTTGLAEEIARITGQSTSGTTTNEANTQTTASTQTTSETLASIVEQLLSGRTNISGTESTTGETSERGGGFSLGF